MAADCCWSLLIAADCIAIAAEYIVKAGGRSQAHTAKMKAVAATAAEEAGAKAAKEEHRRRASMMLSGMNKEDAARLAAVEVGTGAPSAVEVAPKIGMDTLATMVLRKQIGRGGGPVADEAAAESSEEINVELHAKFMQVDPISPLSSHRPPQPSPPPPHTHTRPPSPLFASHPPPPSLPPPPTTYHLAGAWCLSHSCSPTDARHTRSGS